MILNRDSAADTLLIRKLGLADYVPVWQAMQHYTDSRDGDSPDQIWLLEHPPVFTQGQAGKAEHLLATGDIPVVQVDRGGQVTYHGPGQLVGYLLLDLKRRKMGVRELVTLIEEAIVSCLAAYGIAANPRPDAPGVYVESGAKIAQLGLRVRKGCTFHGLSLNVEMDMQPFLRINPCGHAGMEVTSVALQTVGKGVAKPVLDSVAEQLMAELQSALQYRHVTTVDGLPE